MSNLGIVMSKVVAKKGFAEEISLAQAMDNLTSMASLDQSVLKKGKMLSRELLRWWDAQDDWVTLENIKQTFKALLQHLKASTKEGKERLLFDVTQQGIQSLMTLVTEAVHNIDRYTPLIDKGVLQHSLTELKEYQELQEFYQKKVLKKFHKGSSGQELWKEEWGDPQAKVIGEEGIKDLEAVKQDHQYELLYLKKEDGSRFFNRHLLRHIKLVNDFDKLVVNDEHEDPFLVLQKVQDKNALEISREIKHKMERHLNAFLKLHPHKHPSECIDKLFYSLYALYLGTSQNNLLEGGSKKSCFQYLGDFILFLQEAFLSTDYTAHKEEIFDSMNILIEGMILFAYQLCEQLFMHVENKDQMIGLVNRLMDKIGVGEKEKMRPSTQMWTSLAKEYEHLQHVLQKYPNGPLFKTLDVFTSASQDLFEPLMQNNHPSLLYFAHNESFKVAVLRLPSPTKQEFIHKAEISVLFENFIRALKTLHHNQKVLIVNVQDRTAWQEHARCQVLEQMPKSSAFVDTLEVCTLAKSTSFYTQSEEYQEVNSAQDFKKLFLQQMIDAQECGFYFPKKMEQQGVQEFSAEALELIHEHFFGGKEHLSHKNRLDFIEIFYFFLTLKMLDIFKPTHLAITCKDAIDTSAASVSSFFAFLKLMSQDHEWGREEEDFFVWMMQAPALLHRERAIQAEKYHRAISALSVVNAELEVDRRKIISSFEKLYGYSIFKNLHVKEASG